MKDHLDHFPPNIKLSITDEANGNTRAIAKLSASDQILDLMNWANERLVAIVPVSSPGAASQVSCRDPSVIADLSGLNKILHVDNSDCRAIIEPGVTFAQLRRELRPHGLRPFAPLLARGDKSALASYLDRQPTTSPHDHWDSEDPIGGASFIFGNGESFETGSAAVKGPLQEQIKRGARQLMSAGPGATDFLRVIQGSQGTLAINRWASVYCEPVPTMERAFFIASERLEDVVDIAYDILWHRMGGQLWIVDGTQLSAIAQSVAPGFADVSVPPWVLYVNLVAENFRPAEKLAYLLNDLRTFAARRGLEPSERIGSFSADALASFDPPANSRDYRTLPKGAFSSLFFLTQMDQAASFVSCAREVLKDHVSVCETGFYVQPRVHGANCHFEINLYSSADDTGSRLAVLRSHLIRACADLGAYFSRPYGEANAIAFSENPVLTSYLRETKAIFDPKRILSPGRLWEAAQSTPTGDQS